MICAIEAGKRGRRVARARHAHRVGKKILISGGGRCNFTNLHCRRRTSSRPIHTSQVGAGALHAGGLHGTGRAVRHPVSREDVGAVLLRPPGAGHHACCERSAAAPESHPCRGARGSGGKGASGKFQVRRRDPRPSLLPPWWSPRAVSRFPRWARRASATTWPGSSTSAFRRATAGAGAAGLSRPRTAGYTATSRASRRRWWLRSADSSFREKMLFTHRGLSGPAILQISSYWDGRSRSASTWRRA